MYLAFNCFLLLFSLYLATYFQIQLSVYCMKKFMFTGQQLQGKFVNFIIKRLSDNISL